MKCIVKIIIFLIIITFIPIKGSAGFQNIVLIPPHPTTLDTVRIAYEYDLPQTPGRIFSQTLDKDTSPLQIYICSGWGQQPASSVVFDTITFGLMPVGYWTVQFNNHITNIVDSTCTFLYAFDTTTVSFSVTSVSEIKPPIADSYMKLFPNPATSNLTILLQNPTKHQLHIFSMDGGLVFSQNSINTDKLDIDISYFTAGMYYLVLEDEKEKWVKKFVKE
jgi:hypothetical protein